MGPRRRLRARRALELSFIAAVCAADARQALAAPVITSAGAEQATVAIYRAPDGAAGRPMDLHWLGGYALVTEQRTVALPAGRAVLRFEGVAAGLLPESAIVRGLPDGVREKNLDADLLTPRSLYAHSLGRPVVLRRRNRTTGLISEEPAIVRSAPDGAAVLETRAGFEAANCGPLTDSLVYPAATPGLVARPTLSVEVESPAPATATLALSYLAWGFDWQTNYVLRMAPGAHGGEFSAWVTLASGDATSFANAEVAVVGGEANREDRRAADQPANDALVFQCFVTPLPPLAAPTAGAPELQEIVVTARRRQESIAEGIAAEDLGGLKLYRLPAATTLAANAQKQVLMIAPRRVRLAPVYTAQIWDDAAGPVRLQLRGRNRPADGLGLPLPAGRITVFEAVAGGEALVGEAAMADTAAGEILEIDLGETGRVALAVKAVRAENRRRDFEATVANANPWSILVEAQFDVPEGQLLSKTSAAMQQKDGRPIWRVRVPANGVARLRYTLAEPRPTAFAR